MPAPSLPSRLVRGLLIALFKLRGWHIDGRPPAVKKFILVGAPHTSNWDFAVFLGATHELGIRASYLGKHSLFRWPLRRFMLDMGGIPVDRSKRSNYVDQVVAEFARRDELALVIAPEGTRHSDGQWKSGFYHIAMAAAVPIVPAWLDRTRRRIGIGEPLSPTGDYRADLARIIAFYRRAWPDQERFSRIAADGGAQIVAGLPTSAK
ncbi:MAG TPA: lysophospholipid acyltransferase family protein [Sphingomicrobium sp.]|nr:lysophospholipid acyltransferase family protein [Sphingomicrobium sp.]